MSRHRPWLGLFALVLVLLTLLAPRHALASPPPGSASEARPVIVAGREGEIQALFAPYQLGDEITPGWRLHSFRIDVGTIIVWVAGADERFARLTLDHPAHAPPDARRLTGFAAKIVEQPEGSEAATTELLAVIERNDGGKFWGHEVVYANEPRSYEFELSAAQLRSDWRLWLRDGTLFYLLILCTLLGLTAYELRGADAWIKVALPLTVIVGALLRVGLSPEVGLDPWSYTRVIVPAGRVYNGPVLALLHPEPLWLSDVITSSTLAYAVLAPLAVFVHASELLEDKRVGMLAAIVVAILPLHLRFSHSDTGFIASVTIASTVFALLYVVTRPRATQSSIWGWLLVVLFALPILTLYQTRPLNILYCPMMVVTPLIGQGVVADKPPLQRRRALVCALIVCVLTFGWGVPRLFEAFSDNVSEGLGVRTLISAAKVSFSPTFNALLNPVFTPPGLTLLAIWGGVDLWRRRRRWLLAYVVAWYLGFLVAHAVIVPSSPYMQARYHLHLIMPYMLMVACGAWAGLSWVRDKARARVLVACVAAYALASPLIHRHGIRNVDFNDMREWFFVHGLRDEIPAQCTIIEYTGQRAGMRFARVGAAIERGVERQRWNLVEIPMPKDGEPEISDEVRALLEDPPECTYWYAGLPCVGHKSEQDHEAPVCHAIPGFVVLEEVAREEFDSNPYDENLAFGLGGRERIELVLYRVHRRQ